MSAGRLRGIVFRRPARRLLVALALLIAVDPLVPAFLPGLERARYESGATFRFENSDLFSLGPLVSYLREHPRGERPRTVFFGNSIVWGYFLDPGDSLPAQFQRLAPETRVFNLGINGFQSGSAYLVTKAIVDAVDTIYLFHLGGRAHPALPALLTVEPRDVARFGLIPPDPVEARLAGLLGPWHLYRDAYRLQAALFGTSTRQYVYRHKAAIPGALRRALRGGAGAEAERPPAEPLAAPDDVVAQVDVAPAPVGEARRRGLAAAHPLLWDYAELIRGHGKHAAIVEIDRSSAAAVDGDRASPPPLSRDDRADLNAVFRPHVTFVALTIPRALQFDARHLTAAGARAVAQALRRAAP